MAFGETQMAAQIMRLQRSANGTFRSLALMPSGLVGRINKSSFDVVQLNWIGGEFFSIEDIGRINKPLVWRLSDMWPFCGTEHFTEDGPNARWRSGSTGIIVPRIIRDSISIDRFGIGKIVRGRKRSILSHPATGWQVAPDGVH